MLNRNTAYRVTVVRLIAGFVAAAVLGSCASTYDLRAETNACTDTRRACVTDCGTDGACANSCRDDERDCLSIVHDANIEAEKTAQWNSMLLYGGIGLAGLLVILLVVAVSGSGYVPVLG